MRRPYGRLPPPSKGPSPKAPLAPSGRAGAAAGKPPSKIVPDEEVEIIDLGDDLIEEGAEPAVSAPPAQRRTRRHRRPTLRSTISAEIAEGMGPEEAVDGEEVAVAAEEAEAAPQPAPEVVTSSAVVEVTLPTAVELSAPSAPPSAADSSPYLSMDAAVPTTAIHDDVTVQVVNAASSESAAGKTAPARRATAADETTDVSGASAVLAPRTAKVSGVAATRRVERNAKIGAAQATSQAAKDLGAPLAEDPNDDITDPGDLGHTDVTAVGPRPWRNLVPTPMLKDVATARGAFGRPHLPSLPSLDLRGVFCSDGATIASDPILPDDIFVLPARARVHAPLSSGVAARSAGAAMLGGGARRAGAEAGDRGLMAGAGLLASTLARPASRRAPEETLPRGAIIDKYRVEKLLGKGGFAAVYRATHLLLNTQVAIKLLRPQVLARHAHLAKLLYEEARFAARIDHPNVVKVFDVTHTPSITYIVMEYIDGRSLADTIARGRALPWPRVVEIGMAVATGLKVALEARLIHRDIKPANILLGKRGEIKIVDLGLVLRAGTMGQEAASSESDASTPGRRAAIGTFGYMAPEQAIDPERIDFRADIYALGATLYEAAVGAPPFPLGNAARCLEMHARELPPAPESRRPGLPPELSALLLRMLAKKPDDRFVSYDALISALKSLAALAAATAPTSAN
ncbi:MAG TPA: serine/threonine-protein kinase [Polyangia bacterium]